MKRCGREETAEEEKDVYRCRIPFYDFARLRTVEPLLYDHPQNHIGVVEEGWSLVRDSYTNRNHCPSHDMWSYERDGRW